jgi:hypothetical protein
MENSTNKKVSLARIGKTVFAVGISASVLSLNLADKASAVAIIGNGTIQLGVDNFGQLNIPGGTRSAGGTNVVGLRYLPTGNEGTAQGCLCEGWGVADAGTGVTGYANNDSGNAGITGVSFVSTASTATSVVNILGATGRPSFEVTHAFAPSAATNSLYSVLVTIKNTSTFDASDLRYRRVFDWDVEPTAFSEFSTIQGTVGASKVRFASNNGFASSNPLAGNSDLGFTGDFVDASRSGAAFDQGALFDFGLGALAAGASTELKIFYGGAATERDALDALGRVGAEVYSLGQSSGDKAGLGGTGLNTFIFGFEGVGGVKLPNPDAPPGEPTSTSPTGEPISTSPTDVPEPFTIVGTIIGGSAAMRMRKKLKSNDKV